MTKGLTSIRLSAEGLEGLRLRLRRYRIKFRFTQSRVAKEIGLPAKRICMFERSHPMSKRLEELTVLKVKTYLDRVAPEKPPRKLYRAPADPRPQKHV